jgi:CheY-like chemotaxis protein
MAQTDNPDAIFMDRCMASVQKQLLGTETTHALSAQGVAAKICGLCANDVEKPFFKASADSFMIKPFSSKTELLKKEVIRVVKTDRQDNFKGSDDIPECKGLSRESARWLKLKRNVGLK